jgi:hypothetical protein
MQHPLAGVIPSLPRKTFRIEHQDSLRCKAQEKDRTPGALRYAITSFPLYHQGSLAGGKGFGLIFYSYKIFTLEIIPPSPDKDHYSVP